MFVYLTAKQSPFYKYAFPKMNQYMSNSFDKSIVYYYLPVIYVIVYFTYILCINYASSLCSNSKNEPVLHS